MGFLLRLVLAALSGALVFISYAPLGYWWAGFMGMGLLWCALAPEWHIFKLQSTTAFSGPSIGQGMLLGFVHSIVAYLLLLPWIGEFVGNLPYYALAAFLSLYSLFLGAAGVAVLRTKMPGVITFPLLYLAVEYLRSNWPFGGFAWVRLAWGQIDGPLANLVALGGPALVTIATVMLGSGIAAFIVNRKQVLGLAASAVVLISGVVASLYVDRANTTTDTVEVAAIQGNVPRMGLDFNAQRRAVLTNHVNQTKSLDHQVDLIIWPENSADVNPLTDKESASLIESAVQSAQAPILVGTLTRDEVGDRNTMIVFDPKDGVGDSHNKKFLQPFGEYMPFREFFSHFSEYVEKAGDFQPGDGPGTVHMHAAKRDEWVTVGVATCYEVAFDGAGRSAVRNGAEFMTTPTNNATFGFTNMTYQQLAMSRMRAIELDRAVVVAATSGVSAMISPDGTVDQKTGIFEPATLSQEIPLKQTKTIASIAGFFVEISLVTIGAGLSFSSLFLSYRNYLTGRSKKRDEPIV